jgi:hypothetical protein
MDNKHQENYERKSGDLKVTGKQIYVVVVMILVHVGILFDGTGFCAYFCCQVFNRAGEWMCTPFFCCWPDSLMSLRMKIRTGFRLQVNRFFPTIKSSKILFLSLLSITSS